MVPTDIAAADLINDGFCWSFDKSARLYCPSHGVLRRLQACDISSISFSALKVNHRRLKLATHKSAEKRARQSLRRNAINRKTRSSVRTIERKIKDLIAKKDKKAAEELLTSFMSTVSKAAKKGVIHARNASRRVSRVSEQLAKL